MASPPARPPIGITLTRTARAARQAFERAMADGGGSVPMWQVLLLVRSGQTGTQSQLAQALGVTAATVTHHLRSLESQGLVRRWRDESNRRVQRVELTDEGEAVFDRLRAVALRHDKRMRSALNEKELDQLRALLDKLRAGLES